MIIPHSAGPTFSISVSFSLIRALKYIAAGTVLTVAGAAIYFFASYRDLKAENEKLAAEVQKYAEVKARLNYYEAKTQSMEEKVRELERLDATLRDMLKDDPLFKSKLSQKSSGMRSELASRSGIDRKIALEQLEELEKKIDEQENSMKELMAAVTERSRRLAATPSLWPVKGKVTSRFGNRRSPFGTKLEFHDGIDIAAPYGSAVRATADGRVAFSGYKSGYGYTVEIKHGYGYTTTYCHLSRILVKAGENVKKGDVIGRVGSTGRSTGPHVHYMVKVNGYPVNPEEYLK